MKTGKVSEPVLKRSVLKQIRFQKEGLQSGAGIGEDCAVFSSRGSAGTAACVNTVAGGFALAGRYAVHAAVNNIAAGGAVPEAVLAAAVFPAQTQEAQLREMMAQIGETARELGIAVAGGHTEISDLVSEPIISITGIGRMEAPQASGAPETDGGPAQSPERVCGRQKKALPGQDVVMTKWAGLAGTALIAREKREALLTRYPAHFIDGALALEKCLSVVPEAAIAGKSGVCAMHDASRGGIFAALWELAEKAGAGLVIDLKAIPIRQETVEICNFYDVNPYELTAGGSMLMTAQNGYDLVRLFREAHIPAAVIGKVTDSHDRVIRNGEECRFLEPFKGDAVDQIFAGNGSLRKENGKEHQSS